MGTMTYLWGLGGVLLLLLHAMWRLGLQVIEAWQHGLSPTHWLVGIAFGLFMLYSEGYLGFQKSFSPRVVSRAQYARSNPSWLRLVLAPLFCVGFFDMTRPKQYGIYLLTLMIIVFVLVVRRLEQPWRGVVDFGVVAGLLWGTFSLLAFMFQAAGRRHHYPHFVPLATQQREASSSQ